MSVVSPRMICNAIAHTLPKRFLLPTTSTHKRVKLLLIEHGLLSLVSMTTANSTKQGRRGIPHFNTITAQWKIKPRDGNLRQLGSTSLLRMGVSLEEYA